MPRTSRILLNDFRAKLNLALEEGDDYEDDDNEEDQDETSEALTNPSSMMLKRPALYMPPRHKRSLTCKDRLKIDFE